MFKFKNVQVQVSNSKVLYLVRHCQATGQEPDAPLTAIGQQQAISLADWFGDTQIERIISSPFVRAYQSVMPLAERFSLTVEIDNRLVERVLSSVLLDSWQDRLAETFVNLDLSFEGGESSRTAMNRGVAAIHDVMQQAGDQAVIVTHGNLMTLILKSFDDRFGFAEWSNLQNPDLYCVQYGDEGVTVANFTLRAEKSSS